MHSGGKMGWHRYGLQYAGLSGNPIRRGGKTKLTLLDAAQGDIVKFAADKVGGCTTMPPKKGYSLMPFEALISKLPQPKGLWKETLSAEPASTQRPYWPY
jgi:hypothetical protein